MPPQAVTEIASRRELFVDDFLLDQLDGVALHLHSPQRRDVAMDHDAPWEGNVSGYNTVFHDGDISRMYYRGWHWNPETKKEIHEATACYAESVDGLAWSRPSLGLVEWNGSTNNNIILDREGTHNFAPLRDTNPACDESARFKGLGRGIDREVDIRKLYAFSSPDGLAWSLMQETPLDLAGAFDSQNLAFYDANVGKYRMYFREFSQEDRVRGIMTSLSDDFLEWSPGQWLEYPGAPVEHLYTNQVQPYHRAPHLYLGFPTRYVADRGQITEGLFMSSRDGLRFKRWGEAIIRPGLDPEKWGNRCNYVWCGMLETKSDVDGEPDELSIYTDEKYYSGAGVRTRRHVYRMDGFVSLRAPLSGGSVVTKPLTFSGKRLSLNMSTSAAGVIRVEIQDTEGHALEGYGLEDCPEIWGDSIDRTVEWTSGSDVSSLAGRPVRLRFTLEDADIYAMQFTDA